MDEQIVSLGEGFWSIRGSFRIGGLLDIGTQSALVRLPSGGFVMLDSYAAREPVRRQILELTGGGQAVEAIYNLHPFHTIHCEDIATLLPRARLFGTERHKREWPELPWQDVTTDDPRCWEPFDGVLCHSVPDGVDLVTARSSVHFSSVLVRHEPSRTVHVDDTFGAGMLPAPFSWFARADSLSFHPMLGGALQKRAGAVADFRLWATGLAERWSDTRHVCTAHRRIVHLEEGQFREQVLRALDRVSRTLDKHEARYG